MHTFSGKIGVIKEVWLVVSSLAVKNFAGDSKSSSDIGEGGSLQKVKIVWWRKNCVLF